MGRIDQESIKKELIELFCLFLDEPGNDSAHKKAEEISEKYSGLVSYSEHSSEEIISKDIINALNSVEDILEYGLFEDEHPAFSKEKIINNIKNQLRKLSAK